MKRKGFTLVELLAVIVILSIIALLASPSIISLMNRGKEGAFIDEVKNVISSATYMYKNESTRTGDNSSFVSENDGYKIYMWNVNGSVPTSDPYGYDYILKGTDASYIFFKEVCDSSGLCSVKTTVHIKSCKGEKCHCIDKSNVNEDGNEITSSDISDNC